MTTVNQAHQIDPRFVYSSGIMRAVLCHFVLISMLFVSVEGAADMASTGHPHEGDATHQLDLDITESLNSVTETDAEHCEHCCHGHVAGIAQIASTTMIPFSREHYALQSSHVRNFAQKPSTPPPNA